MPSRGFFKIILHSPRKGKKIGFSSPPFPPLLSHWAASWEAKVPAHISTLFVFLRYKYTPTRSSETDQQQL